MPASEPPNGPSARTPRRARATRNSASRAAEALQRRSWAAAARSCAVASPGMPSGAGSAATRAAASLASCATVRQRPAPARNEEGTMTILTATRGELAPQLLDLPDEPLMCPVMLGLCVGHVTGGPRDGVGRGIEHALAGKECLSDLVHVGGELARSRPEEDHRFGDRHLQAGERGRGVGLLAHAFRERGQRRGVAGRPRAKCGQRAFGRMPAERSSIKPMRRPA